MGGTSRGAIGRHTDLGDVGPRRSRLAGFFSAAFHVDMKLPAEREISDRSENVIAQ
jgi:hypothetical protein